MFCRECPHGSLLSLCVYSVLEISKSLPRACIVVPGREDSPSIPCSRTFPGFVFMQAQAAVVSADVNTTPAAGTTDSCTSTVRSAPFPGQPAFEAMPTVETVPPTRGAEPPTPTPTPSPRAAATAQRRTFSGGGGKITSVGAVGEAEPDAARGDGESRPQDVQQSGTVALVSGDEHVRTP